MLSDKQRAFVEHYVRTWNATQAAKLAGYSDKAAYAIGAENLRKPQIRAAIDTRLDELAMSPVEILTRLTEQARGSLEDFLTDGALDLKKAEQRGKLHLLKSYRVSDRGAVYIELYDGQAALVQLARYRKMFTDKLEVDAVQTSVTLDEYMDAKKRAAARAAGRDAIAGNNP